MIIAIDGPAGLRQGHARQAVSRALRLSPPRYRRDYRAVAKALLDAGPDLTDEMIAVSAALALDPEKFVIPRLRPKSWVKPPLWSQRFPGAGGFGQFSAAIWSDPPGAVLDGRDIGTVICPGADVKIFVVADPKVRARRRTLKPARGARMPTRRRFWRISSNATNGTRLGCCALKPASDAYLLDNSHLDIEGGVRAAIDIVEAVRATREGKH